MSAEQDSELRADFVNESGDLLQKLGEQLVGLERHPDDRDLLNAVFRGFHTIKGGAGFFGLAPMVTLCHAAEDVFNILRAGRKVLTPDIMDVVLEALDDLRVMLDAVANNAAPPAAREDLVERLHAHAEPDAAAAAPAPVSRAAAASAPSAIVSAAPDPFSEDEFEKLLDQLHGSGKVPGDAPTPPAAPSPPPSGIVPAAPDPFADGEFEKLLDQLHGQGQVPGTVPTPPAPAPAAPAAASPAAVSAAEPAAPPAETTVRIDTERLDHVMNLVGELVLVRNRLKTFGHAPGQEVLRKSFSELDVITAGLQSAIMQMRMQPIRKLFSRFPRLVRETARKLDKQVEVETVGDSTELDKSLVEALNDPLVHMVRNAVDHGIEPPNVRVAAGKPACGKLILAAEQAGDHILITVRDDGGGMDPERIRRKAIEKGIVDASTAANMSHEETLQMIFLPGFSTKDQVSDLSGRGVGMDVVRSNISALNGQVQIESSLGRGSAFYIRVPLTLAIQPVLMIALGHRQFALPLQPVLDVFFLDETRVRRLDRWDAVLYRNETLRLVRLSRWVGCEHAREAAQHVVVVNVSGERFGLVVGQVRGREEIVVKPLGKLLRGLAGIAGATVTGEGRVALILDLAGLVAAYEQSL
jgi:two-component system chemotaxis sensor kinase CheA